MTVLFPEDIGILCPDEVKCMYGDDAISPGDGGPVVTDYPQFPMSAYELWDYMKGNHPKHCADLQKKYPTYFTAHEKVAFAKFLGGRKVYRMPKGFL